MFFFVWPIHSDGKIPSGFSGAGSVDIRQAISAADIRSEDEVQCTSSTVTGFGAAGWCTLGWKGSAASLKCVSVSHLVTRYSIEHHDVVDEGN